MADSVLTALTSGDPMLLTDPLYTVRSGPVDRKVTLAALSGNNFSLTGIVVTSGVASLFTLTGAAHTGLTASTENTDVDVHLGRTVQWSTGALTLQRFMRIRQPTIGFVGASTVTNAATLQIDGAPIAGTNATLTETAALRVLTGTAAGKGVVIRGAGSQTGNLLEFQNSAGATICRVDSAGQLVQPGGTASIYRLAGLGTLTENSSLFYLFSANEIGIPSALTFGSAVGAGIAWTSGTNATTTGNIDLRISRNTAGVMEINNGTAGTLRDLVCRHVTLTAGNLITDTTTGAKIGTATTQKLGFWNATPVVQQVLATGGGATVDNVITFLQTVGLCKQS